MRFFLLFFFIALLVSCQNKKAENMYNFSILAWENDQYGEALQNFIAFTKTYPKHELADDALYWIGAIYQFDLKQPQQAVSYYKVLIQQFPNSEFFVKSSFYIAKIQELGNASDVENSIYTYQDILNSKNITPQEEVKAYLGIAKSYIKINQQQNARFALKKAVENYNEDEKILSDIYTLLALSYQQEGKVQLAKITYKEAISKIRDTSLQIQIYRKLAKIYESQVDLKNSILAYQKLLSLADNNLINKKQYESKLKSLKKRFARITR